jgi:glutathionylspermidine amidase/synthetase
MLQKKQIFTILFLIVMAILFYYYFYTSVKKFGTIIGTHNGVSAYSNQKGQTNCSDSNYFNGVYTGVKWQCVEYVRRYLQTTHGITFGNVDGATQIPHAKFTTLDGSNHVQTTNDLRVGGLIVWPKYYKNNAPDGHVAVISDIKPNGIYVVEQNYDDKTFPRFIDYNHLHDVSFIGFL